MAVIAALRAEAAKLEQALSQPWLQRATIPPELQELDHLHRQILAAFGDLLLGAEDSGRHALNAKLKAAQAEQAKKAVRSRHSDWIF